MEGWCARGCDLLAATPWRWCAGKSVCVMSVQLRLTSGVVMGGAQISPPGQRRGEGKRRGGKVLKLRRGTPRNAVVSDRMPDKSASAEGIME